MAIVDLLAGLVSGPASRVVEAPVRELVDEILRQQDIARPHEVAQLKREIQGLGKELEGLVGKLETIQKALRMVDESCQGFEGVRFDIDSENKSCATMEEITKELSQPTPMRIWSIAA